MAFDVEADLAFLDGGVGGRGGGGQGQRDGRQDNEQGLVPIVVNPPSLADIDPDAEEGAEPPGIAGAGSCAMAAVGLLRAQDNFDNGRPERASVDLDAAGGSLAQGLLTPYLPRMQPRAANAKECRLKRVYRR
ncbi:hypothetical protein [Streptomyces sp. NPDC094147]